jgi:hypothetical protein
MVVHSAAASAVQGLSVDDRVDVPFVEDALQDVGAPVFEGDARTSDPPRGTLLGVRQFCGLMRYWIGITDPEVPIRPPRGRARVAPRIHLHPVTALAPTAHAHCEPKLGTPDHEHYRYIELSIYEALEEHVNWWASETDLTCERLRPLL